MGSLEKLRAFYDRGVRMVTLTWNFQNSIGFPNCLLKDGTKAPYGIPNTEQGLTEFGVDFVQEMERLLMFHICQMPDFMTYLSIQSSRSWQVIPMRALSVLMLGI